MAACRSNPLDDPHHVASSRHVRLAHRTWRTGAAIAADVCLPRLVAVVFAHQLEALAVAAFAHGCISNQATISTTSKGDIPLPPSSAHERTGRSRPFQVS